MSATCPLCGHNARTRTSTAMSNLTRRSYHQCQNLLCGCTFVTLATVEYLLTKPVAQPLPPGLTLKERPAPPGSHQGKQQAFEF